MKIIHLGLIALASVFIFWNNHTSAQLFKYGWKDNMFSYNNWVWKDEKLGFTWVDYNQKRDLEDRDFIDVDQAFPEWVDLSLKNREFVLDLPAIWDDLPIKWTMETYAIVKRFKKESLYWDTKFSPKFIFVFVHGLNGNRTWWFKDWTFNGNFNRLKHIAYYNNGLYISPTVKWFSRGGDQIAHFFKLMKKKFPNTKFILACGSSGGETCWRVYNDISAPLDWMMLLGSMSAPNGLKTIQKRKIPIYIGHWGKDRAIPLGVATHSYKLMQQAWNPVKLEVFTNWVHWTPLRMVDYLKVLKWMFKEEKLKTIDKGANVKPAQDVPTKVNEIYPQ